MNDGQIHQVSAEIGSLKTSVELMTEMWREQEKQAVTGRKNLHDKLDQLRTEVGLDIAGLSLRVDRLASDFKTEKDQQEGAKRLGARLWIAATAFATVLGWAAHEAFIFFRAPPPHP